MAPIDCAAVASDEYAMAALVRGKDEAYMALMQRLDTAIAKAVESCELTDEFNARRPSRR